MKHIAASLIACLFGAAALAETWTIGPRELPPPAGASEAVHDYLAGKAQPDPAARPPVPETRDAWIAMVSGGVAAGSKQVEESLASLPLEVTGDRIAGVPVHRIVPETPDERFSGNLYLDLHGGAYVFGGGMSGLSEALLIAERLGIETVAVDYRMPPLNEPFPAAVDDAVVVYLALLETHSPESIAVGGTSAGGGLTLALVHRLKAIGAPVPGALYAGTPWSDLTKTGDTQFSMDGIDNILVRYEGLLQDAAALYIGVNDWKDPLISPVYGDFSDFPPTILVTGTRDLFLSDVVRTHRKLRSAGVDADLHVYEALSHAEYYILRDTPESIDTYNEVAAFLAAHLD